MALSLVYKMENPKHTSAMESTNGSHPTSELLSVAPTKVLLARTSAKWREFPADVLPLPVMEMDYEIALPIREKLIEMINTSDTCLLYTSPSPRDS